MNCPLTNNIQGNFMSNSSALDPSKTILICTPPYSNRSAGIVVLHELCDSLVRLGYVAHIILMGGNDSGWTYHLTEDPSYYQAQLQKTTVPPDLGEKWVSEVLDKGITIYPEIIIGNPLNARHVVRYFLNGDGVIFGKKSEYQPSDFCLAFSKVFFEKPHAILTKPIRSPLLNEVNTKPSHERGLNLTYFGKGTKYASCFRIEGSIVLPAEWPKSKSELALLLQNTQYLYSWDNVSSMNNDAIYCGAKVVLMQFIQADEEKLKQGEFGPIPYFKGSFEGTSIKILDNPNYEETRNRYMQNLNHYEMEWMSNVNLTIRSIFNHFGLPQK